MMFKNLIPDNAPSRFFLVSAGILGIIQSSFLFNYSFSLSFPSDHDTKVYRQLQSISSTYTVLASISVLYYIFTWLFGWNLSSKWHTLFLVIFLLSCFTGIWLSSAVLYMVRYSSFPSNQIKSVFTNQLQPLAIGMIGSSVIWIVLSIIHYRRSLQKQVEVSPLASVSTLQVPPSPVLKTADPSLYTSSMLKSIDRQQTDLERLCSIRMLPPEDCKYNQLKLKLVKTLLESKRKGEFTQDIQQLETMLDRAIQQEQKITKDFSHLLPPAKKVTPIPDIKPKQWTQLAKPGSTDLDKQLSSLSSNF